MSHSKSEIVVKLIIDNPGCGENIFLGNGDELVVSFNDIKVRSKNGSVREPTEEERKSLYELITLRAGSITDES